MSDKTLLFRIRTVEIGACRNIMSLYASLALGADDFRHRRCVYHKEHKEHKEHKGLEAVIVFRNEGLLLPESTAQDFGFTSC